MKMKVSVTQQILEKSKNCMDRVGFNCAISLAIRDIFPNAFVCNKQILVNCTDEVYKKSLDTITPIDNVYSGDIINLPIEAINFITEFDNSEPCERVEMEPISFEIDVPEEIIEKIGISQVEEILKNSETLELVN